VISLQAAITDDVTLRWLPWRSSALPPRIRSRFTRDLSPTLKPLFLFRLPMGSGGLSALSPPPPPPISIQVLVVLLILSPRPMLFAARSMAQYLSFLLFRVPRVSRFAPIRIPQSGYPGLIICPPNTLVFVSSRHLESPIWHVSCGIWCLWMITVWEGFPNPPRDV